VSTTRRGIKNAYRNTIRTVSIVLILSISFGLALVMLLSVQAVNKRTASVSQSVGTTITVTPAGEQGFSGGGNPLTAADVTKIKGTKNVTSVVSSVSDRLSNSSSSSNSNFGGGTGGTTSLKSSINPGSLGKRFGGGASQNGTVPTNFSLPVTVTGSNEPLNATVLGASSVTLTSGKEISGTSSAYVADVGKSLASKNDLKVGSTFTAYNKTFTVEGIYNANSVFLDGGFVVPLPTLQSLSGIDGVTSVIANVNNIDNLSTAATKVQNELGTSVATVTTGQTDDATIISSLSSIKTIAVYSLIGALVAGAIILFLSMLMIVRERRREIGILKAFGSSNGGVVRLFTAEALTLTAMGAVGGIILGVLLSNPVLKVLVNNTSSTPTTTTRGFGFGGGGGGFGGGGGAARTRGGGFGSPLGFSHSTLSDLHAAVGFNIILYGVLAAILIAIVGSAIPSYIIAKVRPAEVLRGE
jgi:putative ABC transport system permease protein